MRDLTKIKGTIAYSLTAHQKELFDMVESNVAQTKLHAAVCNILDQDESLRKEDVIKCKEILSHSFGNKYLSTLMTYMTGMKVG